MVALISYSLTKATSKAAERDGLICLIRPTQSPAGSTPARVGYGQTLWRLLLQRAVTDGGCDPPMF